MIYRGSFTDENGEHEGYGYYGSKVQAKQGGSANIKEGRQTPKTTLGILALLKKWGTHNDRGTHNDNG